MKLYFDKSIVSINLNDNPIAPVINGIYRHLQHVPLNFKPWDNPYYLKMPREQLVGKLVEYGQRVNVDIDPDRCLDRDQSYFNKIHKIYEQGYHGDPVWLDFHEHIHMCEKCIKTPMPTTMTIDYREKSGLLEKKFNMDWLRDTRTYVQTGDVYVNWAELGKTPYMYWKNSESDDLDRLCQLAKPWLKLKPKLSIALDDFDFVEHLELQKFNTWWKDYKSAWCQHWNITHWEIEEIAAVGVIGRVDNVKLLQTNLQQNFLPIKIQI
jgi:hypothetical protein